MRMPRWRGGLLALSLTTPLSAQGPPSATAPFPEQLRYLLSQASAGFADLRADSIGPGMWRARYLIASNLDSATALAAGSISELARQHADGRPGKAIVGVFALALTAAGDSAVFKQYRELISAVLPAWQNHSPGGGDWTECADPRRGRELILSSGRTAAGQLLLMLSITVHPDGACS
ncbi:MAG TPA: hypothetical protein VGQ73_09820 [Gemmatimonadales bacterium]|jgi:hypothetical protein|nr:hypothetical protein [Gemmatimonadales bacterium]